MKIFGENLNKKMFILFFLMIFSLNLLKASSLNINESYVTDARKLGAGSSEISLKGFDLFDTGFVSGLNTRKALNILSLSSGYTKINKRDNHYKIYGEVLSEPADENFIIFRPLSDLTVLISAGSIKGYTLESYGSNGNAYNSKYYNRIYTYGFNLSAAKTIVSKLDAGISVSFRERSVDINAPVYQYIWYDMEGNTSTHNSGGDVYYELTENLSYSFDLTYALNDETTLGIIFSNKNFYEDNFLTGAIFPDYEKTSGNIYNNEGYSGDYNSHKVLQADKYNLAVVISNKNVNQNYIIKAGITKNVFDWKIKPGYMYFFDEWSSNVSMELLGYYAVFGEKAWLKILSEQSFGILSFYDNVCSDNFVSLGYKFSDNTCIFIEPFLVYSQSSYIGKYGASLGTEYEISDNITIRGGIYYGYELSYTAGIGYKTAGFNIDVGAEYGRGARNNYNSVDYMSGLNEILDLKVSAMYIF